MRSFLDAILAFIGASSLTDEEYDSINFLNLVAGEYSLDTYTQLSTVLIARDAVSETQNRLRYFFLSKGIEAGEVTKARSNILIGGGLW